MARTLGTDKSQTPLSLTSTAAAARAAFMAARTINTPDGVSPDAADRRDTLGQVVAQGFMQLQSAVNSLSARLRSLAYPVNNTSLRGTAFKIDASHITNLASPVIGSIRARAFGSVAQNIAPLTWTAVFLDSESFNVGGMHSGVNNTKLTVPVGQDGGYLYQGGLTIQTNGTGSRYVSVWLNGSFPQAGNQLAGTLAGAYVEQTVTGFVVLTAGDFLQLMAYQDGGVGQATFAGSSSTYLAAVRIW